LVGSVGSVDTFAVHTAADHSSDIPAVVIDSVFGEDKDCRAGSDLYSTF